MPQLKRGRLGYNIHAENRAALEANGTEPRELLAAFADQYPPNNPVAYPGIVPVMDQGNQGSCAGHAGAKMMQICYFLATGRIAEFSRGGCYYMAQRHDGLIGRDVGSTLSGVQKVLTTGLCLETDWPYPNGYNPRTPDGITFPFKIPVSKPFTNAADLLAWIDQGWPVQTGIIWSSSCDREVVDNYVGAGGGGHSTTLWQRDPTGRIYNTNSWGRNWNQDGRHVWTENAILRMLQVRSNVFIGFCPGEPGDMTFPTPEPTG